MLLYSPMFQRLDQFHQQYHCFMMNIIARVFLSGDPGRTTRNVTSFVCPKELAYEQPSFSPPPPPQQGCRRCALLSFISVFMIISIVIVIIAIIDIIAGRGLLSAGTRTSRAFFVFGLRSYKDITSTTPRSHPLLVLFIKVAAAEPLFA